MAQPTYFKQAQAELLKANGNPDTLDMPMGIATRPDATGVMPYIISKWKFSEDEKKDFRDRVEKALREKCDAFFENNYKSDDQILDIMMNEFDHVWLCLMHTPVPALILSQDPYETAGYVNARPNEN